MVILNVEHQFSSGNNILAVNGAAVHIMCAHRVRPSFSSIFVPQVFVFMAKNGLIDRDF